VSSIRSVVPPAVLDADAIASVDGGIFLEGHLSVAAALRGRSRPIHRILIAAEGVRAEREARQIRSQAADAGVAMSELPRADIDTLASGHTHGGIIAEVGERYRVPLRELAGDDALVVMLDGIEDPYNFAAALRSLYAAGATGLVVRPRSWTTATAIIARASAGASELLPTAEAADPGHAMAELAAAGLRTAVAAERSDAQSLYEADLRGPLFVLIGGERRGVMRRLLDRADTILRIPYGRHEAPSLGTAAAAAVIGFEAMRQRAGA
jgi:23S rRNA (guanosine2251-2'-O)-methyltransferase